jgi:hypothetical protein
MNKHHEIVELFDEHYYSIGVRSGHEALANLLDDYFSGNLNSNLEEYGISDDEFRQVTFFRFVKNLLSEGKMFQSHEEYHNWLKLLR